MSSASPVSVLVVGSGPAGLVAALTLVKHGIAVRIIEKEAQRLVGQRGAGIMPRSEELYNYLGVLPEILAKAISLPQMRKYKLSCGVEPISTFHIIPYAEPTPACPYLNIVLGQDSTEAILRSHLEKLGVQVEYGMRLRDFQQHDNDVVAHVVKDKGGEEKVHDITCHWLVGADGARGVVRKQLGLQFPGESLDDMHTVIADIYIDNLDTGYWHFWGDLATNAVMLRPTDRDGVFALIARCQVDLAKLVSEHDELVKFIRSTTDRDDLNIGDTSRIFEYRPAARMVDKFGDRRVFVAGDAAHVHSPSGAQGMNSSIQDSFNLAWKIALVEKGYAAPSLLATYNEERLPVITAMLQKTTLLLKSTVGGSFDAWNRSGNLSQLGVNCRWSSIVVDERSAPGDPAELKANAYGGCGGMLHAGDRAPDAPGLVDIRAGGDSEGATSFFCTFGPTYHTVVFFTADVDLVAEQLGALAELPPQTIKSVLVLPQGHPGVSTDAVHGIDLVVTDRDGHAYGGHEAPKEGLMTMIVRPDGIVGGIAFGLAGLQRYFEGVFTSSA